MIFPSKFRLQLTKSILPLLVVLLTIVGNTLAGPIEDCQEHVKYGVPSNDSVLLCRKAYLVSHSSKYKEPIWVAYHLTREHVKKTVQRSDKFRADPDLPKGEKAELKDYRNSGYDKGHMMPAADASWEKDTMQETFLLSNIAPQVGLGFNRGIWKELEQKIREWAKERGELYIYVGPIFGFKNIKTIGTDHVAVPSHFFKIIFDPQKVEAIAFVLPNVRLKNGTIQYYIVSINYIEQKTGFNFLSTLDKSTQQRIEANIPEMW
jgi:endonuclease G